MRGGWGTRFSNDKSPRTRLTQIDDAARDPTLGTSAHTQSARHHFRRQVPIDGYIVDFACFGSRLVIEIDGGQHSEDAHAVKDARRDAHLKAEGFRVLRVWNSDVDENFDGVMDAIIVALTE